MEDVSPHSERPPAGDRRWQQHLYRVIFEHDTRAGRAFDVALMAVILVSVTAVSLESVNRIKARYGPALVAAEWAFTALFTAEYVLRLISLRRPWRYALSFFGVVDLLALLPTYLAVLFPGAQSFLFVRALRLLRVFRALKMGEYLSEARLLSAALKRSRST